MEGAGRGVSGYCWEWTGREGDEKIRAPRAAMAGSAPATAMDKTSFATTCSLLSQYVKEKKGGMLQGLGGLAMAAAAGKGNSSFVVRCDPLLSVKCHTAMHE